MTYRYEIDFFKCGTCTSKTHCRQCGREIGETLERMEGVTAATVNIMEHYAVIDAEDAVDEDEILDILDNIGVLV